MNIFAAFLCLLLVLTGSGVLGELLSASVLFRHGDRSPLHSFPSDTSFSSWPQGRGKLTKRGAKQLQELGAFLRHRYGSFVTPEKLLVRSTNTSRTLASARNCLIGLLQKQPVDVPITAPPRSKDDLLSLAKHCPELKRLKKAVISSPEARVMLQPYSDFLTWLGQRAGFSGPMTLHRASAVRDVLFCDRAHNISLPTWMTSQKWEQLLAVKTISWRLRFQTVGQRRRLGGPLLARLLTDFESKKKHGYLRLYSAHDTNVAALLASANIFNWIHPPYASAVFIELHSNPVGVEFYYRNDSTLPPFKLTVPGCKHRCPLTLLRQRLQSELLEPEDTVNACAIKNAFPNRQSSIFGVFFLLTLALCGFAVVALFILLRRSRSTSSRYSRVPTQDEDVLDSYYYFQSRYE